MFDSMSHSREREPHLKASIFEIAMLNRDQKKLKSIEDAIDQILKETFPASDPPKWENVS